MKCNILKPYNAKYKVCVKVTNYLWLLEEDILSKASSRGLVCANADSLCVTGLDEGQWTLQYLF